MNSSHNIYTLIYVKPSDKPQITPVPASQLKTDTMSGPDGFPASYYGEPGVLGMLSNGISAFLVLLQNFNTARSSVSTTGVENVLAGVQLILIGGICQLVAGLLSFRKYDHLSGTAFIGYAALWSSYGATRIYIGSLTPPPWSIILPAANVNNSHSFNSTTPDYNYSSFTILNSNINHYVEESAISGLIPYIILSFLLAFCSATVNYIMPFVFGAITFTLIFEAVGLVAGPWALIVSGILELLILIFAMYGSAALLLKGLTQRLILKGFGTPLFNVLLLGTASSASLQKIGQEKNKNTKYAEPMALGLFCDTVSPVIFAFYSFGYFKLFGLGAIWVTIISTAQLFSSYYANLRQDCYHTTKFGLHATYWIVKAWDEFVASTMPNSEVSVGREAMVGDWFFVLASLVICAGSLNTDLLELIHNILFLLVTVSTVSQIPFHVYYIFFGITCCLFAVVSLYGTFTRLINTIAEKSLIPVGPQPVSTERITNAFKCKKNKEHSEGHCNTNQTSEALFYLLNGLASLSALHSEEASRSPSFNHLSVPWILISGAVIQAYISRLQLNSGRFGSVISSVYVAVWAMWTWFRFTGEMLWFSSQQVYGFTAGAIALLVVNVFIILMAAYRNLVLLLLTIIMEVVLVCFLLSTLQSLPYQLEMAMLALFSITCLYGALASLINGTLSQQLLPLGPPLLKEEVKPETTAVLPCPVADSRLTSGLLKMAALLGEGGVCGIPTDTVYALAASCKSPEAIEKIYHIKVKMQNKGRIVI
uniref:Threonylcarbamoyl-AMP synthase n=1 Tax=Neogobius melanostomus TaxID=47308 RepID=A0A8C6T8Y6_9GOBI